MCSASFEKYYNRSNPSSCLCERQRRHAILYSRQRVFRLPLDADLDLWVAARRALLFDALLRPIAAVERRFLLGGDAAVLLFVLEALLDLLPVRMEVAPAASAQQLPVSSSIPCE